MSTSRLCRPLLVIASVPSFPMENQLLHNEQLRMKLIKAFSEQLLKRRVERRVSFAINSNISSFCKINNKNRRQDILVLWKMKKVDPNISRSGRG